MWQFIGIIIAIYVIVDVIRGGPWRKIILAIAEGIASSGSSGSSSDSSSTSHEWKIKDKDSSPRSGGGSSGGGGASSDF
jgi:uncharacterized membrane protein YgcG